jgi:DNA-binding response OmpR family regulator
MKILVVDDKKGLCAVHEVSDAEHRGLMTPVRVGDLLIDPRRCEVAVRDKVVALTPKEFQILALLAESPGQVFTKEDLVRILWGDDFAKGSISIPVYIRRIRKKIEKDPSAPKYLQTVWRFGYRLGD